MPTDRAARYWGFRTDPNRTAEIVASLKDGELRQGWGYQDDLDLNHIGDLVRSEGRGALNDDQRAAWRRCQRTWPGHWDPIGPGDVLLLPKVPRGGEFSLVRVTGPYRFDIHPQGDLGHVLPIEMLRLGIPNSNVHVEAGLQRTLRQRSPIWEITRHAAAIESLLEVKSRDVV